MDAHSRPAERGARTRVTADRVVEELARIAFADVRDVVSWGASGVVTVKPSGELELRQRLAKVSDALRRPPAPAASAVAAKSVGT